MRPESRIFQTNNKTSYEKFSHAQISKPLNQLTATKVS
jgi:hypothetical protein